MQETKKIAQDATHKDTGNMAFNSLVVRPTNDGFQLSYRYIIADYIHFLNDGTVYTDIHKGWANRVAQTVAGYINMSENGQRNSLAAAKGRLEQYPDNERRQRQMMASIKRNVRS